MSTVEVIAEVQAPTSAKIASRGDQWTRPDGLARASRSWQGPADSSVRSATRRSADLERHRDPVDGKGKATGERWPIHRDPPTFSELSPKVEIFGRIRWTP